MSEKNLPPAENVKSSPSVEGFTSMKQVLQALASFPLWKNEPKKFDECRKDFGARLQQSGDKRYFCFCLLSQLALNDLENSLAPAVDKMRSEFLSILDEKKQITILVKLSSDERKAWFARMCRTEKSKASVDRWYDTRKYLLPIYSLVLLNSSRETFSECASYFASEVRTHEADRKGQKQSSAHANRSTTNRLPNTVRELVRRVPEAGNFTPSMHALLRVLGEMESQAKQYREDIKALRHEIQASQQNVHSLSTELTDTKDVVSAHRKAIQELSGELAVRQQKLDKADSLLSAAKHQHGTERDLAVSETISRIRRECVSRLEDIRLYADQDTPDSDAIVRITKELESIINSLGDSPQ